MTGFTITENHPHIPTTGYALLGRGGAGNAFQAEAEASVTSVQRVSTAAASPPRAFYSGRGGAGNFVSSTQPAKPIDFDEEMRRAEARDRVKVHHVGVGGAGNVYRSNEALSSQGARDSMESQSSRTSGIWGRLSGNFSH